MRKLKKPISFLLLFVFGFLSLKNLFSDFNENIVNNCHEFGHIHIYKSPKNNSLTKVEYLKPTYLPATHSEDDDDCHEGKFVFNYTLIPYIALEFGAIYKIVFAPVFTIQDFYLSPYHEPLRKPPKLS